MVEYVNLTPHPIHLNDGRMFPATGQVARVTSSFTDINDDICETVFGEVYDLPEPVPNTRFIVSGMVLSALNGLRDDVVAPATGHPLTMRNEQGHIVSVPCFTR